MKHSTSPIRHPELVSGSIVPFTRSHRLKPQPHGQIAPLGVRAVDKVDLPCAPPVLEPLLAHDGLLHIAEHLEVDEPIDAVARGEPGQGVVPMLPEAAHQVRGDADVKRAVVPAREDVDARAALDRHALGSAEGWALKQVQGDEEGFETVVICRAELVRAALKRAAGR